MDKEYYAVSLQFESLDIKSSIEEQLIADKHDDIIFDENSDELYSEDPSALVFLLGLVAGGVVKEGIARFFEYLKEKLKKDKTANAKESITVNVHIDQSKYKVVYHLKDDSQEIEKI